MDAKEMAEQKEQAMNCHHCHKEIRSVAPENYQPVVISTENSEVTVAVALHSVCYNKWLKVKRKLFAHPARVVNGTAIFATVYFVKRRKHG